MLINDKAVSKLKPAVYPVDKRLQIMDEKLTGFGVRVESDGRKSFFWSARIKGKLRFRFLGEYPTVTVEQARTSAETLNGLAATWRGKGYEGADPFERSPKSMPSGVPTFKDLIEAYITVQVQGEASRPEKAEADLRGRLKTHFTSWMNRKIDTLTVEDVLRIRLACGKHHATANRNVELVRRPFNWSASSRNGRINFWPVKNIGKDIEFFDEKEREVFLQPDQLVRFNECLENETHSDLKDFLILAITTGARKSDIFSMRWHDWQHERQIWTVPYSKTGSYDVSLLPSAVTVLERRYTEAVEDAVFVFPGVGKEARLMELRKPWNAFRKRANIPDINVHDLRRTMGSYLAINGTPLLQIAAALGHRSTRSTLVYARLQEQPIREAREAGQAKMLEMMNEAKKRLRVAPVAGLSLIRVAPDTLTNIARIGAKHPLDSTYLTRQMR